MRVALSFDMEGISQVTSMRECLAASEEYWDRGRAALAADVIAAAEGLLAGGADEVAILDNHGSGNAVNLAGFDLPAGARLESWNVFELGGRHVDAMLQVGYHARGGVDGFLSHTYVPGLRLRVGDELISESHGRIWAAGVPLLGIVGNDLHERTLGSLAGTPFLVVQRSRGRGAVEPAHGDPGAAAAAIRDFAAQTVRDAGSAPLHQAPSGVTFAASLPNGDEAAAAMEAGGWSRTGASEFTIDLETWDDARGLLDAAMAAGFAAFGSLWLGSIPSREALAEHEPERREALLGALDGWAAESQPEWHSDAAAAAAPARAVVVPPGQGHHVGNVEFMARSKDTKRFNLAVITIQPHRGGPPPHVHAAEDDSFYILEGELTFLLDEGDVVAGPGTFVLAPPGVRHTFANRGDAVVRMVNVHAPAGFDLRLEFD